MIIKNIPLKVIEIKKIEGISKKTRDSYLFYTGMFLDELNNPLKLTFNPNNFTDESKLLKAKDVKATINFKQKTNAENSVISANIKELDV